jgi:3-deoxy-D-manno-octulosonic-acid transferase
MLWLYRLCFLPALLVVLPAYARRMRRRGGYGEKFGHRFGGHPGLPAKAEAARRVWLQAVSVGEMLAVGPLLEALHRSGAEVYLTTTTSTGYQLARERYAALTLGIGYFPIDWWLFSARAWKRIDPDLVVLTEGERWPEHVRQARLRGVPVVGINARISDRSFRRLRAFRPAARLVLADISRLLPASALDEARFRQLGFSAERLTTTGNLKLDVAIPRLEPAALGALRRELGLPEGPVLVGASTWPGEETALVAALQQARAAGLACTLLLVPRHAERRESLEHELAATGLRCHFRSRGAAPGPVDVAVADTTGELRNLLQLADLVFVGKSLPPHAEGQTPVEAAALEKPILFGPGMGNFKAIARDLRRRGAALEVADPPALAQAVRDLLGSAEQRERLAAAVAAWHRENGGAMDRTLAILREELAKCRRRI